MASNNSDNNNKPRTNIFELLPEVHRSDLNETLFEAAFNRHLTKDDTSRVAGFIGERNLNALVNRQIQEPTPHRQAFQLAPTMYTRVGRVDHVLTQREFLKQLELIGVDINRLPQWGNTLQFNWVPPINIDMLVNFFDYYWNANSPTDLPQYFTIENRCNKAKAKAESYAKIVAQNGELHTILEVNASNDSFVISDDLSFLFTEGFVFFTKNTVDVSLANKFWTTVSSTYDSDTNKLTIFVQEDVTAVFATGDISLTELLDTFQREANCVCAEDFGWDLGLWDDGQLGDVIWNTALLTAISHPTEADWITANGAPAALDLWYDTTTDELKQRNIANTDWIVVAGNFTAILALVTGKIRWDLTIGCVAQELNQWSAQNKWIHKTQVQSFTNVKRAQIPIIEFSSTIELNEWTKTTYDWKYRALVSDAFEVSDTPPHRWELEPVKGYAVTLVAGVWTLYLFDKTTTLNRDIDHTTALTPGTILRIVNDSTLSQTYTVARSEYRETIASDPISVRQDYMVTVVELVEPVFTAPLTGGGILNTRIEPVLTSKGDVWRGYHVHWTRDEASVSVVPTTSRALNPFLLQSLEETPTTDVLINGIRQVGIAHQTFTPNVAGVTIVDLDPIFLYDPLEARFYATPGSNEIRVYVNDVRQYGTYVENTANGIPSYTAVGFSTTALATIPYVTGITFNTPLNAFDVVRIEICPAAFEDSGLFAVPIRTVENETAFTAAVVAGTQPEYKSLSTFQRVEQVKTEINQYPLFNVYNVCEDVVINASPLFSYKEEATCPINPNVRRRIVASPDGRDYTFIQFLLDRDDNRLFGYRNLNKAPNTNTYWYSPFYNTVLRWDGKAWTDSALLLLALPPTFITATNVVRKVVISDTEPTDLLTIEGTLWLDKTNKKLFQRNTLTATWTEITSLIISDADPTLETVWKNGNNHEYVPEYVDAERNIVPVGDPTGDWEVFDWWFFNSEHKNKQEADYTQLVTHFRSVLAGQTPIPGLPQGGTYAFTQNDYDYGVGGIIKEHNDSYDTLISAINVTNVTPVGLMEWAEDQYTLGLLLLRDIFNRDITRLYGTFTKQSLADQTNFFTGDLIQQYRLNDYTALVFGDTSAYTATTDIGMPNWIGTVPIFRLGEKFRPHLNVEENFVEVFHHDGHRTTIVYTPGEEDRFSRQIIALPDARVTNGTLGVLNVSVPPTTESTFLAAFGGTEVRTGVYWYQLGGGFRVLYRFTPYEVVSAAPSLFLDGEELPNGTRYYNIVDNLVYIKVTGPAWVPDTGIPFDISTLWKEVDFAFDVGQILVGVEQRLFDIAPDTTKLVFDFDSLTPTPSEQAEFDKQYERRFFAFVAERNIKAPLVNTTFSATDAFTWNYVSSIITTPPRTDITPDNAASWQALYTRWYGTPYPHLEPWKLQGYHDKPTWWDEYYLETDGSRRWIYDHGTTTGMWENIRIGVIPAPVVGQAVPTYPNGAASVTGIPATDGQPLLPIYNYFSVNIDDVTVGGFDPDDVFPPYLASTTLGFSATVRSLFSVITEIVASDADFAFGDLGPTEWLWTVSSEFVYDTPIVAFLMQPARFLHDAFGLTFIDVDKLQVETTFCQVYSHEDALFHGDIFDTSTSYTAPGLNQWYVNFNRASGFDTNTEFRALWAGWNPQQSYQFAGIVDTSTFEISTKFFDITNEDYQIVLANTGVLKDIWAEGFEISVLNIPPTVIQFNNQALWRFDVDSLATVDRSLSYYGVRLYPFAVNLTTDVGTIFQYNIVGAASAAQRFFVEGNQTLVFLPGVTFTVSGSTSNDGVYTTMSAVFEPNANRTRINVEETVPSSIGDGVLDITSFTSPWTTGQTVVVQSTRNLPAPLVHGVPYFIINTGPRTFQLAETLSNALAGIPINITTTGNGELTVGEVLSSFIVFGGAGNTRDVWFHYAVDKSRIINVTPPFEVSGMQNLLNFFDGYAEFQRDQGEIFNLSTATETDEETGRSINWQFEEERFINWAYGLKRTRMQVADRFQFSLNGSPPTDELIFTSAQPAWLSGTPITFTTTGSLPSPLVAGVPYYFVQTAPPVGLVISANPTTFEITTSDIAVTPGTALIFSGANLPTGIIAGLTYYALGSSPTFQISTELGGDPVVITTPGIGTVTGTATSGVFKVSITSNVNIPGNIITFTTSGSGTLFVSQHRQQLVFPSLEVNPTRNNIWLDTPQGLLANVITGPFADIRVSQTIFDQHGRPLTADKFHVLRQDKQSRIAIRPELNDDLSIIPPVLRTQFDFLHFGGGHFFLEGFEHVLLFNDRSVSGSLIYDQFFGLFTKKFDLDYHEKTDFTLRPTLGGHYLLRNEFFRNIEGATVDLHNYYDTHGLKETTTQARFARNLLGYRGRQDFLDKVNMGSKSQFLFYKGMIQHKGSVAGAKAYINSRRFIDAKIDEFWAWKIADFGDPRPRVYPQIKLFSTDATVQDVRLHFLGQTESTGDPDVVTALENDFNIVDFAIPDRWEIHPEQKAEIVTPLFLDADVTSMFKVYVGSVTPTDGQQLVDFWYNPTVPEFRVWNGGTTGTLSDWDVTTNVPIAITANVGEGTTWVRLDRIFDDARVIQRQLTVPGDLREYTTVIYGQGGGIDQFDKVNSEIISFQTAGFVDVMILFTINPGFSKLNPSKIIDKRSNVVASNVQLWDPARSHHSTIAIHNVDLQKDTDPAGYLNTKNPNNIADFAWGTPQVETVWLDTSILGYKKYYDDKLFPDVNDRLNSWGNLAPWSQIKVYEWVQSSVPPDEWADLVVSQATDSRPQRSKATGTARQTLFRRERPTFAATAEGITSGSQIIDFSSSITGASSTGLTVGTQGSQAVELAALTTFDWPTNLRTSGPFTAIIEVDGTPILVSVGTFNATGTLIPVSSLVSELNAKLQGLATVTTATTPNRIVITSNTVGANSSIKIEDINLFQAMVGTSEYISLLTAVAGTETTYTATITIDGTAIPISVVGDSAQTFDDLVDVINEQLGTAGAIAISGDLVVTSASTGTSSTVSVVDTGSNPLFASLTNFLAILTATPGTFGVIRATGSGSTFVVGQQIIFTTTDTLPSPLEASATFIVDTATPSGADQLLTIEDTGGNIINISSFGSGTHTAVPSFGTDWVRVPFIRERQYGPIQFVSSMPSAFEPTITLSSSVGWVEFDKVDLYINDVLILSGVELDNTLTIDLTGTGVTIVEKDIIDIVRPLRALTLEEETFDPDSEDDGTVHIQWQYDHEFSVFTTFENTVPVQNYYFWVEGSQFRDTTDVAALSAFEVALQLARVPTPYFVVLLPKDDPSLLALYGYGLTQFGVTWSLAALAEQFLTIPVFYRQAVLRNSASLLTEDERFVWRFTRDLSLRTSLKNAINLKNKHQEWFLFRREQPSAVPRELWNRLEEAVIGHKLNDVTIRVPSLERELFDTINGTDTRFGLGEDQAFCDKDLALTSILAYLQDPNNDFAPVDIDTFFATHSFDTPENILEAMEAIFNSFSAQNVNNIFFETLHDAFSTRAKYKELFKTSWIALHGIRVLEVGGLFDD